MSTIGLLFAVAGVLIALVIVVLLLVLGYVYWWQIARAQPQLDGTLRAPVFDAPVEVLRDKHGIPHIYAQSRADLFRAQGFVHAQDRFWQMEQARRTARGTLAELFGEAALEADRFSRTIGFLRIAEAEFAALDADTRNVLEWYAEGVNQLLQLRPHRVAAELNLLRMHAAPWQPLDSLAFLKMLAWGMSGNWESELVRLRLLLHGDPYRAAELEPNSPAATPIISEADGVTRERLLHGAGLLLNLMEPLKQWLGSVEGGQGSNAWVIAPKLSMTRKPILANDPHLTAQIPGAWYENHLEAGDFTVAGASFAGCPGVVIGHNEEIAWGIANGMVDQQDLYIEKPHPENAALDAATPQGAGAPRFAFEDAWEAATVHEEVIRVRRLEQPHVERVVVTRHGPLITSLLPRDVRATALPIAVRWTGSEPGTLLRAFLKLNAAASMEDAEQALRDWDTPSQSMVLADVRGTIGWVLAGRVPLRGDSAGVLPAQGWTRTAEWQGYIPFAEMPRVRNPELGYVVAANNKPVGDDFPHFLGMEFDSGWRAARIAEMLTERERYSVRDIEEMQTDTLDKYAGELVRWIALLHTEDPWEKVSLQALRKWNLRMDVDSVAALVFHYVLIEMLALLYADKLDTVGIAYLGNSMSPIAPFSSHMDKAQQKLLELLNDEEDSFWYGDGVAGARRTRDEFLQEGLTRAVRRIREAHGDSTLKWQWGRVHQVQYAHPLGSARLLKSMFNRGLIPIGGSNNTPLQTRNTPLHPMGMVKVIPSYRQIIEVGNWDRMQSVTATGQSGHPMSANYDNQIVMWREGVYHQMPWTRAAVEKVTVNRLLLSQ